MSDSSINDGLGSVDPSVRGVLKTIVHDDGAICDVGEYFADTSSSRYTGAWFERLDEGGGGPAARDIITSADVVALSFLSVRVPGMVALKLLVDRRDEISSLLWQIPTGVPLWEVDRRVLAGPGNALFELIRSLDEKHDSGHRWVTAHKLLARKRPELFPIRDSVVGRVVPVADGSSRWLSMRAALQDVTLRDAIERLRHDAGVSPRVTVLRTLDIAIWMHGRRTGAVPTDEE